ncbi:MAG TPA: response regulator transcription factor [Ktedonobacterales bacterium]|nr:response regulator transcription factor [Ktedonobacterales bacterium]
MLVYVVASYPTVRAGLASLVGALPGWRVAGQSAPDSLAMPAIGSADPGSDRGVTLPQPPEVVLADLDDETDATVVAGWLDALRPTAGVVALTVEPQGRRDGRSASAALLNELAHVAGERGLAFGALRRDATPEEIAAALGAVAGGLITLDRRIASLLLQSSASVVAPAPERLTGPEEPLTARELDVLQLLAQGLPNKIIATRLHITEHTAKFHVSSILMKLGAASRTEAVTTAARRGLLML